MLSEGARHRLRAIAESAVRAAAHGSEPDVTEPSDDPELLEPSGAFVSLHLRGRLRGCIGTVPATRPVWETVRDMAVSAARRDPRFSPLTPAELEDLEVEVSVLSPLRPVERVEEIEIGRHGLYVISSPFSGLLLPQVATDRGWDRVTFLEQTCRKAGLPKDAWKDPETEVRRFEAEVF
jgi:AmmeMemoRadiSam system protein A